MTRGLRCPSEVEMTRRYGIQCPCILGSTSRAIVEHMDDLTSIIVCPSAGATVWVSEWEKFVDDDALAGTPAAQMKLYVHLSNYVGTKPDFNAFCEDMEAAQLDGSQSMPDIDADGGGGEGGGPAHKTQRLQRG